VLQQGLKGLAVAGGPDARQHLLSSRRGLLPHVPAVVLLLRLVLLWVMRLVHVAAAGVGQLPRGERPLLQAAPLGVLRVQLVRGGQGDCGGAPGCGRQADAVGGGGRAPAPPQHRE
jgi:hypothetical protein